MTFPFNKTLIPLLILITIWTRQSFSQELKIERKQRLVSYLQDGDELLKRWRKVEDNLYTARLHVPSTFLHTEAFPAADPFADDHPKLQADLINENAKKVLEEAGVTFGKGAKVKYDFNTSLLTVTQTRDQLELIEAYLTPLCCRSEKQIAIRAEIYELPTIQALELLESCEGQSDHTPERNAVRQLVKQGGAKLVALPSVISSSGQRSKIISAYEVPFLENVQQETKAEDEEKSTESAISVRSVGTLFEVDPVLGADGWTLDISFNLEHHTGPPESYPLSKKIESLIFHSKEITTQVTLLKGSYVLIGTWKPTGKPEYENSDLMHVVFLTANVQGLRDYGVLLPAGDPPTKK